MIKCIEIATRILGGADGNPNLLNDDLANVIECTHYHCVQGGSELKDPQVIALLIMSWRMNNPGESAYGMANFNRGNPLKEIDKHFDEITIEEFEENLKNAGIEKQCVHEWRETGDEQTCIHCGKIETIIPF